jgi:polar amino acid transport system substrate-binding protein
MSSNFHKFFSTLILTILFSILSLLNVTMAAVTRSDSNLSNLQNIITSGKLVVAMPAIDDPIFFGVNKEGKLVGFDVDLAHDIAKELGVKVEFLRASSTYDGTVDVVAQGKTHVAISYLSKTLQRAKKVLYTDTYANLYQCLLVNRVWFVKNIQQGIHNKNLPKALVAAGCVIGTVADSAYITYIKAVFPEAAIKTYREWDSTLQALFTGEINAIFNDDLQIKRVFVEHPDVALKYLAIVFHNKHDLIAIAVAPQNRYLLYWLNHYLKLKQIHMNAEKLLKYAVENKIIADKVVKPSLQTTT